MRVCLFACVFVSSRVTYRNSSVDMRLRATLSTENTPNPAEDAAQLSEDQSGSIPQEQLQQEHLEPLVSDSLDQQKQEEDVDTAATFNDEIEDVDDDEMMDMVPSSMVSSIAADTVAPVAVGRKDGDIEMMEGGGVGDDQVQDEQGMESSGLDLLYTLMKLSSTSSNFIRRGRY